MATEDLENFVQLSPSGWTIECGQPRCGIPLADVAWIDINFNMALNSAESDGSLVDIYSLPPAHLRRYRLGVMFPFDWVWSETAHTWQVVGGRSAHQSGDVTESTRIVRGSWSTASLSQFGLPPFKIVCFGCGFLQTVRPERRKGTPAIPKVVAPEHARTLHLKRNSGGVAAPLVSQARNFPLR